MGGTCRPDLLRIVVSILRLRRCDRPGDSEWSAGWQHETIRPEQAGTNFVCQGVDTTSSREEGEKNSRQRIPSRLRGHCNLGQERLDSLVSTGSNDALFSKERHVVAKGRCSDDAVAWCRRGGSGSEGCSWQVLASSGAGGHPAAVGARRDAAEGG